MIEKIEVKRRNIGFSVNEDDKFLRVWSPNAKSVQLVLNNEQTFELTPEEFGYWFAKDLAVNVGDDYRLRLNTENGIIDRADPASLQQPTGIHTDSRFIDLNNFEFTDQNWRGIPLEQYIIYELHIGTFTPEGTFLSAIEKLDHLLELGITAVEIMPVSSFPGERNWGYDGVFPFAVQESYGGPKQLQNFVNECHNRGIAVILDVVYNHFGPEGNHLADFGPYFTDKYQTPWGQAINFDDAHCDAVRAYFIENVLMWFRDFHIDALRLDAVHAINDFSVTHILAEMRNYVDQLSSITQKPYYLIAECDLNDVKYLQPLAENGFGMEAQWADDFHHALRVTAGEPRTGYYKDFKGIEDLAKAYRQAFVYDGIYSEVREKSYGSKPTVNPAKQFVVCSQNHDQIGNRMLGERAVELYGFAISKVLATAVLFSPFVPLLFMGEEWGETNRFQYFVSHTDEKLVEAVRKGRRAEFKDFHLAGEAPDPQSEETFKTSKLKWNELEEEQHLQMFSFYKDL
ncbi:MAG: malto-oligosyltrehalose trehalohydrolase, partial [Flavobacteriales bacterium]